MASRNVLTGAHVVLFVNGRPLGIVTSFMWTRRRTVRRVQGIDQITPSELVPGPVAVSGQIGIVRTRRDGGAEGAGLIPPTADLTREQYVSLTLRDRTSDTPVVVIGQALVDSEGWRAVTKDILSATVSFEGIDLSTEVRARGAG